MANDHTLWGKKPGRSGLDALVSFSRLQKGRVESYFSQLQDVKGQLSI